MVRKRTLHRALGLIFVSLLLLPFNNCSNSAMPAFRPISSDQKQAPTNNANNQFNGGGYSGKLTYLHYSDAPTTCPVSSSEPDRTLEVGGAEAMLTVRTCSGSDTQSVSMSTIFQNPYDPYYLAHEDFIFVNRDLLTANLDLTSTKLIMNSFCYNAQYSSQQTSGLDFGIQFIKSFDQLSQQWKTTTIGHLVKGHQDGSHTSIHVPGRLKDNPENPYDASFFANDGSLNLVFIARSTLTQGTALLSLSSGEKIEVECYQLRIRGPGDGQ